MFTIHKMFQTPCSVRTPIVCVFFFYKYSTISHLIDMFGHDLPNMQSMLCWLLLRSVNSFWKIGRISRSKSSLSDVALYIDLSRLGVSWLFLSDATFGVLWKQPSLLHCWLDMLLANSLFLFVGDLSRFSFCDECLLRSETDLCMQLSSGKQKNSIHAGIYSIVSCIISSQNIFFSKYRVQLVYIILSKYEYISIKYVTLSKLYFLFLNVKSKSLNFVKSTFQRMYGLVWLPI